MSKPSFWIVVVFASALLWPGMTPCSAQDAAPPDVTMVRPSNNGFDELMQAGDASVEDKTTPSGKVISDADSGTATLTQRCAAVREPVFRLAPAAMRDALRKPIELHLEQADDTCRFAGPVRRLGRMLAMQQYVLLSDGKVVAALDF